MKHTFVCHNFKSFTIMYVSVNGLWEIEEKK